MDVTKVARRIKRIQKQSVKLIKLIHTDWNADYSGQTDFLCRTFPSVRR